MILAFLIIKCRISASGTLGTSYEPRGIIRNEDVIVESYSPFQDKFLDAK